LDWTQSSDTIGAVSQAYELQFMNLNDKIAASSVRDAKWATWTGKFGYQVK
jgi:WD40 repeat protein